MRDPKRLLILCAALLTGLLTGCKTQRPVVDIDERMPEQDTTLKSMAEMADGKAILKVSALSLPLEAKTYTRVSVLLKAKDQTDISISNYMLKSEIPIRTNVKYALTVVAYKDGQPLYSNEYCHNSNRFTSRPGSNNYTVPVCPMPVEAEQSPSRKDKEEKDDSQMIETPSSPGG